MDYADSLGDDLEEFGFGESDEDPVDDSEIELMGSLDGEFGAEHGMPMYGSYGMSANIDDFTDEQREFYDDGYYS